MKYIFLFYFLIGARILLLSQPNAVAVKQDISSVGDQSMDQEQFIYPTSTMVKVNPKKISEGLRTTLGNVGYVGWEKGNLYLEKKTNEYALQFPASPPVEVKDKRELSANRDTTPARWYFFTYDGRPFSVNQWQQ